MYARIRAALEKVIGSAVTAMKAIATAGVMAAPWKCYEVKPRTYQRRKCTNAIRPLD